MDTSCCKSASITPKIDPSDLSIPSKTAGIRPLFRNLRINLTLGSFFEISETFSHVLSGELSSHINISYFILLEFNILPTIDISSSIFSYSLYVGTIKEKYSSFKNN